MKKRKNTVFETFNEFSHLNEHLDKPALLESEHWDDYETLENEVVYLLQPQGLLESIDARDIAISIWEANRFQIQSAALINAELPRAIEKLIDPKSGYVPKNRKTSDLIKAYRANPTGAVKSRLLEELGIRNAVNAHALVATAKEFMILDKIVTNRNAVRKAALREYVRQKELNAKHKRVVAEEKSLPKAKKSSKDDFDFGHASNFKTSTNGH